MASPYKHYMDKLKSDLNLGNLDAEYVSEVLRSVYLQGRKDERAEVQAFIDRRKEAQNT